MRSSLRFAAIAASTALVAGVGIAAVAPAQAANNSQSGTATLTLNKSYVDQAKSEAGITFGVKAPGQKSVGGGGNTKLTMQIKNQIADGSVPTKGKITIGAKGLNTMVIANPIFGWATGATTSNIKGAIVGTLHQMRNPWSYLNGTQDSVFDLTNVKSTTTWKKTKALLGGASRVSVTTTTGNAQVTSDTKLLDALDWGVGSPWFQAGDPVGTITVKLNVLHQCADKQECDKLSK